MHRGRRRIGSVAQRRLRFMESDRARRCWNARVVGRMARTYASAGRFGRHSSPCFGNALRDSEERQAGRRKAHGWLGPVHLPSQRLIYSDIDAGRAGSASNYYCLSTTHTPFNREAWVDPPFGCGLQSGHSSKMETAVDSSSSRSSIYLRSEEYTSELQ